jgi:hypothetical protein
MNNLVLKYPSATEWMWNYCVYLGPYRDSNGEDYDLGVYIDPLNPKNISAAIVYGDNPGDYYSGPLEMIVRMTDEKTHEVYVETRKRAAILGLYSMIKFFD